MSAAHRPDDQLASHVHSPDHVAANDHDRDHAAHGTLRDYLWGFSLSVVLTVVPFWLVMSGTIPDKTVTAIVIAGFAAMQVIVHMIFFLHMNARSEGGWNLLALIFTVVVVVISLSGSLWVMYHLNTNMMPTTVKQMEQMP
jgi:cytochrome o ubiquinol oxidase operon protein cyoD